MFNYAAIWAFGGTIHVNHRDTFSTWWKQTFEQYIDYPDEGTVSIFLTTNIFMGGFPNQIYIYLLTLLYYDGMQSLLLTLIHVIE